MTPIRPGFEECNHTDWLETFAGYRFYVRTQNDTYYYKRIKPKEKRIKPKEKTIREIVEEEHQGSKYGAEYFIALFERILKDYVKKEG